MSSLKQTQRVTLWGDEYMLTALAARCLESLPSEYTETRRAFQLTVAAGVLKERRLVGRATEVELATLVDMMWAPAVAGHWVRRPLKEVVK